MSAEDQALVASWAYKYGQAVRQLSNRQTTTMKKFGTMPDYMSIRNVEIGEIVVLPTGDLLPQPMDNEDRDDEEENDEAGNDEEGNDKEDNEKEDECLAGEDAIEEV